jgi:hypothetical protein
VEVPPDPVDLEPQDAPDMDGGEFAALDKPIDRADAAVEEACRLRGGQNFE